MVVVVAVVALCTGSRGSVDGGGGSSSSVVYRVKRVS